MQDFESQASPPVSDRQQRIAATNATVLSAIKAANPQSPIRDWWTGHDYSVWEGIKCRDGIIVGMSVPQPLLLPLQAFSLTPTPPSPLQDRGQQK